MESFDFSIPRFKELPKVPPVSYTHLYYSINQFIKIDLLKQCKLMGLSLKEIEELLKGEITADSMIKILEQQRMVLDEKIKELEAVKSYIDFLDFRIKESTVVEDVYKRQL